jgi:hypothetical protein
VKASQLDLNYEQKYRIAIQELNKYYAKLKQEANDSKGKELEL